MNTEALRKRQQLMIEMYESGAPISEIAEQFDLAESSVRSRMCIYRKQGLVGRRKQKKKEPAQQPERKLRQQDFSIRQPRKDEAAGGSGKLLEECHCSCCGKTFYKTKEWVYHKTVRSKSEYYCSWGCMRQAEQKHQLRYKRTLGTT